jgi:uncharacterized protein involved in cysteine biosynthesis
LNQGQIEARGDCLRIGPTKSWQDYDPAPPGLPVKEFLSGFTYLRRGYLFIREHRKLWLFALPTALVYLPVFFIFLNYFPSLVTAAGGWIFSALIPLWAVWYWKVLIILLSVFIILPMLFIILIILATFVIGAALIASIFNDLLAEKTEELHRGQTDKIPFSLERIFKEPWIVIIEEAKKLGFYFAVQGAFFALSFIPVAGPAIYVTAGGMFTIFFLGFEYIDYPMARRLVPFKQKWSLMIRYRWRVFGFGCAVSLAFLIPVFNVFAIVFTVIGATLLFLDMGVFQENENEEDKKSGIMLTVKQKLTIVRRAIPTSLRRDG